MELSEFRHLKLSLESDGKVLLLEFDHGKANEMGREQVAEVEQLARRLDSSSVVALISYSRRRSSKGTPIFISGANVTERTGWRTDEVAQHVRWQRRVLGNLRLAPVFHVAVVDGLALGWGTEFLLAADYRIAGDEASFGLPETGLGIVPGAGGTSELWAQIGVADTLRLGMTGERIGADEAKALGLVQERATNVDEGLVRARVLAARAARNSPTAMATFKRGVLASVGRSPEDRAEGEARAYEHCLESGDAAIGRQHFEAIREGGEVPWGSRRLWSR